MIEALDFFLLYLLSFNLKLNSKSHMWLFALHWEPRPATGVFPNKHSNKSAYPCFHEFIPGNI